MKLVTINQALILKDLGFKEYTTRYAWKHWNAKPNAYELQKHPVSIRNDNHRQMIIAVPSVDEAIDWLRRKYNIVIANSVLPFVDPTTNKILYQFTVKRCNLQHGWNFREILGKTKSYNIYAAKRMAITIALKYVKKSKNKRAKIIKL